MPGKEGGNSVSLNLTLNMPGCAKGPLLVDDVACVYHLEMPVRLADHEQLSIGTIRLLSVSLHDHLANLSESTCTFSIHSVSEQPL